jgi:16S rRNA (uracil1498-N3)-methyltransferase
MKKIHWFTISGKHTAPAVGEMFDITDLDVIRQIAKVLRLEADELIVVRTFEGTFEGRIRAITKGSVQVMLTAQLEGKKERKVSLFFCIPKKDKFELILEKCTEIGVTDFYPIVSDRTIKTDINVERSLKIIEEASEQAQRVDTPTLHPIQKLGECLENNTPIVLDVEGKAFKKQDSKEDISILIGPEGGFSQKELDLFKEKGLKTYKLGENVLKTETAAIVACGLIVLG